MANSGIKIFAPACISMHYMGLKDLSVALDNPGNEIIAHIDDKNISAKIELYSNEKNDLHKTKEIVIDITNDFLKYIDSHKGVRFEILNRIPFDAGLGQIEAAITGSIVAINDVLKSHLEKEEIFDFIIKKIPEYDIEISPSIIAANLFGGIILYNKNTTNPIQKIYSPQGINFTILLMKRDTNPHLLEKIDSRSLYNQSSDIALLIKGFMISDLDLIADALRNNEFESIITKNDQLYNDIKTISLNNGAYSTGFTHLGESIVIFNSNTLIHEINSMEIEKYLTSKKLNFKIVNSQINLNGMYKY
jgi:homoserine kinase